MSLNKIKMFKKIVLDLKKINQIDWKAGSEIHFWKETTPAKERTSDSQSIVISFGHVISAKIDCENLETMNFTQGIP